MAVVAFAEISQSERRFLSSANEALKQKNIADWFLCSFHGVLVSLGMFAEHL